MPPARWQLPHHLFLRSREEHHPLAGGWSSTRDLPQSLISARHAGLSCRSFDEDRKPREGGTSDRYFTEGNKENEVGAKRTPFAPFLSFCFDFCLPRRSGAKAGPPTSGAPKAATLSYQLSTNNRFSLRLRLKASAASARLRPIHARRAVVLAKAGARLGRATSKRLVLTMLLSYLFDVGMTVEQITEEALALPSESRALLADKLVESLDTAALSRTDEAWLAEAKRRRDEVRSGRVQAIPGNEAFAKVRQTLGK